MIPNRSFATIRSIDIRVAPGDLPWAEARRAEVEAQWAMEKAANPHIFNGEVLLLSEVGFQDGHVSGTAHVTRYANQIYWIRHGRRDTGVAHLFSAAVIVSSDGAVLLGRMADHTINAGQLYSPCGSLDRSDIVGDRVDVYANMAREVAEETGLDLADAEAASESLIYRADGLFALFRIHRFNRDAATLMAEIGRHIAGDEEPELSEMVAIRGPEDMTGDIKPYMADYLHHHFGADADHSM
ncbi:NUDIX hydrolase [Pseudohoeflea suaedae]|uniref:NUDIX hydrolase n=1 Tax=Pseudohoeflea suaedae TaxID=877384 RepID=A0A4R5PJC7_9HYPH|nr:NUDIX hydrolase [Pseudohoeflea suaedae]TDH35675.1 NUDIX hydrolase [Pseudohoeflea suaedae]